MSSTTSGSSPSSPCCRRRLREPQQCNVVAAGVCAGSGGTELPLSERSGVGGSEFRQRHHTNALSTTRHLRISAAAVRLRRTAAAMWRPDELRRARRAELFHVTCGAHLLQSVQSATAAHYSDTCRKRLFHLRTSRWLYPSQAARQPKRRCAVHYTEERSRDSRAH